jgi:predicted transcriptional regulator
MNKIQLQQRADNRKAIMEALNANPAGLLSAEIAETTGISVLTVKRLLIGLRDKGLIFSRDLKERSHTHIWSLTNIPPPPPPVVAINIPYPNLDKDHEEWLNAKKPVYNPR